MTDVAGGGHVHEVIILSCLRVCADMSESSLVASWSTWDALAVFERGRVFRSDNVDAQVDLGLTCFSTIKGHFHVTTVKLRFSLPLFVDNLCSSVFFVYCIIFVFLFAFCHTCLFVLYVFHYALLLWRKIKYLSIYLGSTFKQAGLTTASDQTVRAVHSFNCWIDLKMLARKGECAGWLLSFLFA